MAALKRRGWSFGEILDLTPRQISVALFFDARIDRLERAQDLTIQTAAARGDKATLKDLHKELGKEL